MIEPTDEMVQLALDVFLATSPDSIVEIDAGMSKALVAVLAVVERDYRLTCRAEIDSDCGTVRCVKDAGHDGGHRGEHPSAGVFWS